ncbi:GNAT family N-acetyltransferase [Rugosimonospora africana]|uniref:N-acetyltransferase domain-containing protein n=1 Tax=Rugosimonospora africana TaxID=556532 RepID=A0A8J3QTB2_9ACTN|nr:GNAT family N-acetyltransferase [Rugosimonospora africana]GIH15622.1 hypothetical protein Raf01_37940 [Rugosimonospora africana]
MAELSAPTEHVRQSFLDAMAEFRAEGRGSADDHTMIGGEIRRFGESWSSGPDAFRGYVEWLRAQSLEETPRPENFVPCTSLWWVDGTEYLGRVAIRHRLTDSLREFGGHIGYDVRSSARRRGHATGMLRAALPVARSLGIDRALLTCDAGNTASRKVIEHNGGQLEDQRGATLRFWIPIR